MQNIPFKERIQKAGYSATINVDWLLRTTVTTDSQWLRVQQLTE
jgi:hypothetical protein